MEWTQEQRFENAILRINVYSNLDQYLGRGNMNPAALCDLLGYKNLADMKTHFTLKDIELCRALAGPYGYTIYRMLLAQNEPPK